MRIFKFVVGLLLLAARPALAVLTCDGNIGLAYINPPVGNIKVGDQITVQATFGSGDILGGTLIAFHAFQFDLDCDLADPLNPPCTDAGPLISYDGDASIVTNCPVSWASNNPGGGSVPNEVQFTASPFLLLPPNVVIPPGFCSVRFVVTVENLPAPGTSVGEVLGYQLAFCDNGLVSSGFQTAAGTTAFLLEHYDCYQTPRGLITPVTVNLTDRFGSTVAKLTDIHRLCAPTDKNDENPGAELDPLHYASFTISKTSGFTKVKGINVDNQFGTYHMDVIAPIALLEPASKGLDDFLLPLTGEQFQCYRLNNVKGPAPKGIHLVDQFGSLTVDIDSRGPHKLCVSVDKNGEQAFTSNALMCLHTKNDTLPFGEKDVFLTTQFGQNKEFISEYDELCVPSEVLN